MSRMIRLTTPKNKTIWIAPDKVVAVCGNGKDRCISTVDGEYWTVTETAKRIVQLVDDPDLPFEEEEQAKRDAEGTWLIFTSNIGVLAARTLNRLGITTKEKLYEVARDGQTTRSRLSCNGRTRTKVIECAEAIFGQELP